MEQLNTLWLSTGLYQLSATDDRGLSMEQLNTLWLSTGLYQLSLGQFVMIVVGLVLLFLAIRKNFEPLLLIPIGFGGILANIPVAGLAEPGGLLYLIYEAGLTTGVFPLLIFMGVGAMTDFGPLLANPRTLLLGAAAQFGIFAALLGALALNYLGLDFSLADAASIGIIGGADGPTSIYVTSRLSPELLGAVAVAAYSYMALVPLIQPPVIRLLTTEKQRRIKMEQLRPVGRLEKILFPILLLVLVALLLPDAAPLLGMFCFGNLMKESGVVNRLVDTTTNALMHVLLRQPDEGIRGGEPSGGHHHQCADQHRDHPAGAGGGRQARRRAVSGARDSGYSGAGSGGVRDRHWLRRADGAHHEPLQQDTDQSDHRRRRCVGGADGRQGGESGGPGSQPAKSFADARHGA